jgi:hypothetical protein
MRNDSQYGTTVLIDGFGEDATTSPLSRIPFSKDAAEDAKYSEAWLQHLIMKHPEILPVDQIEPAFADLVAICTELPTPSGFVDNLFVTPTGNLAIIECKLWRNPEARREVTAQIIDYAKDLSGWDYSKLDTAVQRTKAPQNVGGEKQRSLYSIVAAHSEIDEASFIDAVSRNLQRGRFLLLIVGDGIREGVEGMTEFLQQHAGLHFTFAIIELALFEIPGGYIAQPRILAKTTNIDRGIVTVNDSRIIINPPTSKAGQAASPGARMTITKERFLEKLENNIPGITKNLEIFIDKLDACAVSPEFGVDSMILRWYFQNTGWNLGTLASSGDVRLDQINFQADRLGAIKASQKYMKNVAGICEGASVRETKMVTGWWVKNLRVDSLLKGEAQEKWLQAITEFQREVVERAKQ